MMPPRLSKTAALSALLSVCLHVSAQDFVADAGAALAAQDYETAIVLFNEHLAANPDDGAAHYQLGIALMSQDSLEQAAVHFERAGELGFQPQGVGYRLARIYARQGKAADAVSKLEEIATTGFAIPNLIVNQPDFDAIRDQDGYAEAVAAMQAARYPCKASDDHRAFDFWIGSWNVTSGGTQAGNNEVYPILGDCVIFENWTSASGNTGKSFNYFDRNDGLWHQIWIDDRGGVLNFSGEIREGQLHYEAEVPGQGGAPATLHRLVFTPNEDGSVRQYWTSSTDSGANWQVAFDGRYERQGEPERQIPAD